MSQFKRELLDACANALDLFVPVLRRESEHFLESDGTAPDRPHKPSRRRNTRQESIEMSDTDRKLAEKDLARIGRG